MTVADLVAAMEQVAPLALAEPWDNVGLLVGDTRRGLDGPVLLTIDLSEAVLAEAIALKACAVVSYHPPIGLGPEPIKRITGDTPRGRIVLGAAGARLAVYTPHTALDAARGGLTDWLCEGLSGVYDGGPGEGTVETPANAGTGSGGAGVGAGAGFGGHSARGGRVRGDCRALTPAARSPATQEVKIVTFVPAAQAEHVRNALATAGAGIIGAYQVCSFSVAGVGSFLGGEGATPRVGRRGELETVEEIRLEMVCSRAALALAMETLREFHPYEEPAADIYELLPPPTRHSGPGRRLVLDEPVTLEELTSRVKKHLGVRVVQLARAGAAALDRTRKVTSIGVCAGAGADLARRAADEGCEVFVTGEMKHHECLAAVHAGMSLILAGHTQTERGYLPRLASRLGGLLALAAAGGPAPRVVVSQADRSPCEPV